MNGADNDEAVDVVQHLPEVSIQQPSGTTNQPAGTTNQPADKPSSPALANKSASNHSVAAHGGGGSDHAMPVLSDTPPDNAALADVLTEEDVELKPEPSSIGESGLGGGSESKRKWKYRHSVQVMKPVRKGGPW